jgi:hypothetical protein
MCNAELIFICDSSQTVARLNKLGQTISSEKAKGFVVGIPGVGGGFGGLGDLAATRKSRKWYA